MRSSMAGPLALSSRRQLPVVSSRRLQLVVRVISVVRVSRVVAGQDLVHLPPGPLQELLGRADLVRRAGPPARTGPASHRARPAPSPPRPAGPARGPPRCAAARPRSG